MHFSRSIKIIAFLLIVANVLLLSKFILFRKPLSYYKNYFKNGLFQQSAKTGWKKANTTPFITIRLMQSDRLTYRYKVENLVGNVAGFIPLGFLLPLLALFFRRGLNTVVAVFLISLAFEYIQLRTGFGVFDVDDLLLNTIGGLIGYLIFAPFNFIQKRNSRAIAHSAESTG